MPLPLALLAALRAAGPLLAGEGGGLLGALGGEAAGGAVAQGVARGAAGTAGGGAEFGGLMRGVLENVGKDVGANKLTEMLFGGGQPEAVAEDAAGGGKGKKGTNTPPLGQFLDKPKDMGEYGARLKKQREDREKSIDNEYANMFNPKVRSDPWAYQSAMAKIDVLKNHQGPIPLPPPAPKGGSPFRGAAPSPAAVKAPASAAAAAGGSIPGLGGLGGMKGLAAAGGVMALGGMVGGAAMNTLNQAAPEFGQAAQAFKTMLVPMNLFNGKTLEAAKSLAELGKAIVESRRKLAPYSGTIAGAFSQLDRERMLATMDEARGTAGTTGFAVEQQRMLIQETQDLRKAYANATNLLASALTIGQRMVAIFLRNEPVSKGIMWGLETLNRRLDKASPDARAVDRFLKEQVDGYQQKARNRRPGED